MENMPDPAMVAVVIPLFKHSALVVDALQSVLNQTGQVPFRIIVVNDGCPFLESDLQVKSIVSLHSGLIRYVFQRNRGLSAARNTGIDYALKHFPSIQAIYFLDADNTILPKTLNSAYSKLQEEPDASWIYPNIDMFGLRKNFDYSGPYSLFRHTLFNICEAGSLVHRRVFDAGVRFDETMKHGYEDWDFWLTAAERGFRGAQHPHFGFCYRNRGESMLSQSHRDDAEIRAHLRRKHPSLLGTKSLMRLESAEAMRYAILFTDTNEVMLTSGDFSQSRAISQARFDEMLWKNIVLPTVQPIPPFFVLMAKATFEELEQIGLIAWVLFDCEITLKDSTIACRVMCAGTGHAFQVEPGGKATQSDVLMLGRDLLCAIVRDVDTAWIERIVLPDEEMKLSCKTLSVPYRRGTAAALGGTAAFALLVKVRSWRASPYRFAGEKTWVWRDLTVPATHSLYFHLRAAFGGEVVYPSQSIGAKNIGFVLPIASFGGVERVAYNVAEQFALAGWRAHIFVIGKSRLEMPREFSRSIASINFLDDASFGVWDLANEYQGTALSATRNNPRAINRIVAALAWLDAVVNCHSGDFSAAAAELRHLGVKTVAHLHLLDLSPFGRSVGHPMIALAYEHAYNFILCNSERLKSWMHGSGIPWEKLISVPNAPGHPVDPAVKAKTLALRSASTKSELNVLYLGRLDRQKGIDRLAEVVQQTREQDLAINWRIVGSSVTNDYVIPVTLQPILEPAVFEGNRLTSLFSWADVMVLLSDFEGVPLSVLEAQRLGVVVIATNVGSLSEVIVDGKNGFLVEPATAIQQTVALLKFLANVPALRSTIAASAAEGIEWPQAVRELVFRLNDLVETSPASGGKPQQLVKQQALAINA